MSSNLNARAALIAASLLTGAPALAQEQTSPQKPAAEAPKPAPQLTKAPVLMKPVDAKYPPEAAAQGLTADVKMIITIAEDGTVSDAQLAEPVGHGFDEAALEAVRAFQFSPAEVDGVPAPVQVEYVYHFTLSVPATASDSAPQEEKKPLATLTGQLISRGSRSRVAGATVRCGDDPDAPEALSDGEGRFTLQVEPGLCAVRVVASNFQLYQTTETLKPNETTEIVFYLVPTGGAFETVVRSERPKKEVVRRTVSREEAQKTPGTFGDPIRVIQTLPGVARAPFISGELLVRGSNPGQTATLMDGVRIPLLFHLLGGPSVVNAEFIDSLDFYPGGYGSQYGRAVGGVVDVATRKGASDTLHGSVKVDVMDAGFFIEAAITDGVSVAAAARRSYVDALIPLFIPDDEGSTISVVPKYWDYQVRVDFGLRSKDAPAPGAARSTGHIMAFGADDQLGIVASGDDEARDIKLGTHTHFHRIKGDWTYRWGKLSSSFTPYVGIDKSHLEFGSYKENDTFYSAGARELLSVELNSSLSLRTGFDAYFEHVNLDVQAPAPGGTEYVPFPGAEPEAELFSADLTVNGFDGGLFLEADYKLGPLTVTPGVRGNLQHANGKDNLALDPRLWLRYAASERTTLKGSAGLYSQHPETFQFILLPYGNPRLGYQRAFQASLGVEQRLLDVLNVDVTGFFNRRFKNVVSPGQLIPQDSGAILQERYSNDGVGKALGVELMLKKDRASATDKLHGWVSYTFSRAEDGRAGPMPAITESPFGGGGSGDNAYGLSPWDQTHILTVVAGYLLGNGWELGGRFRYTTGRPSTPLVHPYDVYGSDGNGYSPIQGPYFSARAGSFHQLDMRVDKSWQFQSWTLTAYLDVQNLYNRKNAEFSLDDYRYREQYELPGIPLLPVLGVKGSF
ncbi:TonB family protein [Hyalangium versicolor]|uniref:TonB family protein n=1 Tax=Hyalangium versicolor TaxID=2861190 RepID=UPI001CCD0CF3|nr:TonB family protein [Hyalangium versicolor]